MPNAGEYQIYSVNPIQFGCSIQSIDNGVTWVNFSAGEYPAFTGGVMVLYKTHSRTFGSDGIYLLSIDMNYIYFGYQSSDITFTANKISLNESTGYYEIVTELGSITTTANAAAPLTLEDEELAFLNELDGYMGEMVVSHTNKECVVLLMLPTASKLGYAGEINYLICSYT